jgi:hypothetical protein
MYRISVHQNLRQTKILAKRFDEIKLNEKNCQIILNAFPEIMHYDVHWFDLRTLEWSSVCMEDVRDKSRPHWPGDGIVSAMYALHNDLRSCLDEEMRTLRREMISSLVIYWFEGLVPGEYPFEYSINQVCEYIENLNLLQRTSDKVEYQEVVENTLGLSIFETAEENYRNIGGISI